MNTPPNPGIPSLLLAVASKFGFKVITFRELPLAELGVFIDDAGAEVPLRLCAEVGSEKSARAEWRLEGEGCIPFAFDRATFLVLHEGTIGEDGNTVEHGGQLYRIEAQWDGYRPVAHAVAVG